MAIHRPVYVIADDLTGTCDTAAQFASSGIKTFSYVLPVAFATDPPDDDLAAEIICVNTNTRTSSSDVSNKRYYEIGLKLRTLQYKRLFKKIDTALRGNIGPELAGLMTATRAKLALVAPALPHEGRTTIGGRQYIQGVAVEETNFANDPLSPVKESHLPTLLKPFWGNAVEVVSVDTTRSGRLADFLEDSVVRGIKVVVIDAESYEDLEAVALAVHDRADSIFVGSLSIALALKYYWFKSITHGQRLDSGQALHVGKSLLLCGSRNERSLAQLEWVRKNMEKEVAVIQITANNIRYWLANGMADKELIFEIKRAGTECKDIACFIRPSDDSTIHLNDIERIIESYLAFVATTIIKTNKISGLAIIGGDTAMKICCELGIGFVEVTGDIGMVAAASTVRKGPFTGLRIVTKGGSVGSISICKDLFRHLAPIALSPSLDHPVTKNSG